MRDLMIDIETLGSRPGSVILSIGAVYFDAETGELGKEFYAAIKPSSCIEAGLTTDIDTMLWWMKQSTEAQDAAFSGDRFLAGVLGEFGLFAVAGSPSRVWAKPPSFDLVLMEAAMRACKLSPPWHFRTHRDCRTLFDITGVSQPTVGVAHNALDDAKAQAAGVIEAYRLLANTPSPQPNVDPALVGIAEEMKESGGHWQPCTGCYDTEDGHPTQKYDYSPALQTEIGCGCHECGGLGAVWWHMTEAELASYAEDMNSINDDAIDAIQRLMDKKGLKRKDLFPAKSRASEYMSRKRPLSIATIRKLHFEHGIPAEVLIAPYRMATQEDQDNG